MYQFCNKAPTSCPTIHCVGVPYSVYTDQCVLWYQVVNNGPLPNPSIYATQKAIILSIAFHWVQNSLPECTFDWVLSECGIRDGIRKITPKYDNFKAGRCVEESFFDANYLTMKMKANVEVINHSWSSQVKWEKKLNSLKTLSK